MASATVMARVSAAMTLLLIASVLAIWMLLNVVTWCVCAAAASADRVNLAPADEERQDARVITIHGPSGMTARRRIAG